MFAQLRFTLRMLVRLAVVAGIAGLLWFMVSVPGSSYTGMLHPLGAEEKLLADRMNRHVGAIASREHNFMHPAALEEAAQYLESVFRDLGYQVLTQPAPRGNTVRNIEVELAGGARSGEIVIVGAHYDSGAHAVGGNDNGSGVAALIELARLMRGSKPARTVRFVAFVDEEPPAYHTDQMGSRHYARRSKTRGENVTAMVSLETIGYYSDAAGSQRYPFPLSFFYPDTGNFIAFVANLSSRPLLHETLASFRRHARFPSEGVAAPSFLPGVDWSDHWSFWEEGYPALMVTDTAPFRYPHYHTMQDTPDKVNYERLARAVTGLHGMLRDLAQVESSGAADERRSKVVLPTGIAGRGRTPDDGQ